MEEQFFILKIIKLIIGICQNFSHVFVIDINSFSPAKSAIPNEEHSKYLTKSTNICFSVASAVG